MQLVGDNGHINYRVWKLVQRITKRYPSEERSDPLYFEINQVLTACHDKLLESVRFYLQRIQNNGADCKEVDLKTFKNMLKVFRHLISQDLPAAVEDNLGHWTEILMATIKIKPAFSDVQLNDLWFKCKGEAISSVLMFGTRYRDDWNEAIEPFAAEIWKTISEGPAVNDDRHEKIIVNAMKYFKSFSETEKFHGFFSQNITTMFTKVLIPNLSPDPSTQDTFNEEPDSFVECLISNKELGDRAETSINFIRSLSKFHNTRVEETIKIVIGEYIQAFNNNQPNSINEVVCLNLVCFACVTGFRPDQGVVEINMHKELITETYVNLVKKRLGPIFEAIDKKQNLSQLNDTIFNPLLVSYHLKFIILFRNFLNPSELLDISSFCSAFLSMNCPSLQKLTLRLLCLVLSLKQTQVTDNMHLPIDTSSYYSTYYLNPKKVKVQVNTAQLVFNNSNVQPQIANILQNLYTYIDTFKVLEPSALSCLETIFKVLEGSVVNYLDPFIGMFKTIFGLLNHGYNYESLKNIFECVGNLVVYVQKDQNSIAKVYKDLLPQLNALIDKNDSDIMNFVLQIYALMLRYIPGGFPDDVKVGQF